MFSREVWDRIFDDGPPRMHRWNEDTCEGCKLERRTVQSQSKRRRDHGAVVRYTEVRKPGGKWTKIPRGHALPACGR